MQNGAHGSFRKKHGGGGKKVEKNIKEKDRVCVTDFIMVHKELELIEVQLQGKRDHTHDDTG